MKLRDQKIKDRVEEDIRHLEQCDDKACPCWQGEAVGWFDLV